MVITYNVVKSVLSPRLFALIIFSWSTIVMLCCYLYSQKRFLPVRNILNFTHHELQELDEDDIILSNFQYLHS